MRISQLLRGATGASILLLAAACAPDEADERSSETPDSEVGEPTPLAEFKAKGHTIAFYDEGNGTFGVVERSPIGEASLLDKLPEGSSPSEIFARLGDGPVPEGLLAFEAEYGITSSLADTEADANEAGRNTDKHEAGAAHFTQDHCPQAPYPEVWTGFSQPWQGDQARAATTITPRKFCWSAGHTGPWTESATASVMSNAVSAVTGDVCFTRTKDTGSASWTILQGQQLNYNTFNRRAWFHTPGCPSGSVCSSTYAYVNAPLTARVGCAEPGDVWRWGGIFKSHNLKFYSYY